MSKRKQYNREFLERYCKDNDIKYESIDESIKVTRETRIKGNCKGENCIEKFDKVFRQMVEKSGPYCDKCTSKNATTKLKKTCLEKYGVENTLQSQEIKDKIKQTCLEKYGVEHNSQSQEIKQKKIDTIFSHFGVCHPMQLQKIKDKIKQTCLKKYGVENALQSHEIKDKIKQTNIEKYGFENPMQSQEVKDKGKQSCLEKYGVEYSLQSQEVKDKGKQTCLKKYGTENASQSQYVRDKVKQTCLEKYGVEYYLQSQEVKDKGKQTNLERYGVEHNMQNAEIAERASKSAYKLKDYTFPSGKVIKCQGYEPYALDILITEHKIREEDIITSKKEVPEIWYKDSDDKDHRYYVDIFIKSLNKFIEVKSTWTYKKNMEKVELTKNTVKEKGFLYECWVFDGKGNIVETIQ